MNLVISLRNCQSYRELGNEVMNFTLNLENLRSSLPAKFTPFGVVGMSQNFLRHCGYEIQREIHNFVSKFMS